MRERRLWRRSAVITITAIGVIALISWFVSASPARPDLASSASKAYPLGNFLVHVVIGDSVATPGRFLVNHARYFGMAVPLMLILWPEVCEAARRLGPGMSLYVSAHLLLAINPQSRHVIDGFPAVVVALTLAVQRRQWPRFFVPTLALAAVALSTVWFPGNYVGAWGLQHVLEATASLLGRPFPPSTAVVVRQFGFVGAVALLLWLASRGRAAHRR